MPLGQVCVCVCEYVHLNMCFQTSSMSRLNFTDHVLYQNILWHAWKVGHGINLDYYVFFPTNSVVILSGNNYQWQQITWLLRLTLLNIYFFKYHRFYIKWNRLNWWKVIFLAFLNFAKSFSSIINRFSFLFSTLFILPKVKRKCVYMYKWCHDFLL